jgi:hypothetical protein
VGTGVPMIVAVPPPVGSVPVRLFNPALAAPVLFRSVPSVGRHKSMIASSF